MNIAILIGRLTKDTELRYTTTGTAVAQNTIAVNRPKRDEKEETDFINIVVWGKQAENLHKYCLKGNLIALKGRIQTRTYTDQNGQKKYAFEVVTDSVQFLESKKEKSNSEVLKQVMTADPFAEFGKEVSISDYDLPF